MSRSSSDRRPPRPRRAARCRPRRQHGRAQRAHLRTLAGTPAARPHAARPHPASRSRQAEETSENLVRGNQMLDSAAKHSRDFRLLVLSFLITASFALLFLDWYYD